jgi:peroxiredoxin
VLSRSNSIILALALIAAIAGGWLQYENKRTAAPSGWSVANVGDLRPDLVLQDANGKPHSLSEFRGQRVLINFWATWCGPCLTEMPALNAAQRKFADQGGIVLGIAMDEPSRVRDFLKAHPVGYPILIGRMDEPSTSLTLGDRDETLPFSVLLDASGRIMGMQRGPFDPSQLDSWLSSGTAP